MTMSLSRKAAFRFCTCIETMNPPLTHPRRGTERMRTNTCSPPGRGRGWVGSWKALMVFRPHSRTTNCGGWDLGALASWTAAVLCRFCARGPDLKAPEDWRSPKPDGDYFGSQKISRSFRLRFNVHQTHVNVLPAAGLAAVNGDQVPSRFQRRPTRGIQRHFLVIGGVTSGGGGERAINIDLRVLVVMKPDLQIIPAAVRQ